jgi:hypothetical protein
MALRRRHMNGVCRLPQPGTRQREVFVATGHKAATSEAYCSTVAPYYCPSASAANWMVLLPISVLRLKPTITDRLEG